MTRLIANDSSIDCKLVYMIYEFDRMQKFSIQLVLIYSFIDLYVIGNEWTIKCQLIVYKMMLSLLQMMVVSND